MKFLCQIIVSIGLIGFAMTGCERHHFDDTKVLHLEHGKGHGEPHDEHAGDTHPVEADHGKKEAEAKPAATQEPRATGL